MYPRNNVSPERIAIGQVILIADGTAATGVTITTRGQGGAETTGDNSAVYGADNTVYYTPSQAETNFTSFTVIASKASCISSSMTVITSASSTAGQVDVKSVAGTSQTANDNGLDINTLITQVGTILGRIIGTLASGTHNPASTAQLAVLTDWINGGRLDNLLDAIPTTAMRGTDNAALASLVTSARMGALTDWIDGGRLDALLDAIPTTAMRGTDSANTTPPDNATITAIAGYLDTEIGALVTAIITNAAGVDISADIAALNVVSDRVEVDTQDIQAQIGTAGAGLTDIGTIATVTDVTNEVTADVTKISGDATAADNLEASLKTMVLGTATGGTTASVTSAVTGHGDDTFIGRVMIFRTGVLQYEAGAITDYDSAAGTFTFAAATWTTTPAGTFVIV
jgi:hypothetical protein